MRKSIESIMGSNDYLEQYFATNLVFEPLVGELFRSGFLMQAAAAQGDFITPPWSPRPRPTMSAISPTPSSCFTSLARTRRMRAHNIALFNKWLVKACRPRPRCRHHLQPIWSQPRVKVATFGDALGHAKNRIKGIATELGLKVPANLAS